MDGVIGKIHIEIDVNIACQGEGNAAKPGAGNNDNLGPVVYCVDRVVLRRDPKPFGDRNGDILFFVCLRLTGAERAKTGRFEFFDAAVYGDRAAVR